MFLVLEGHPGLVAKIQFMMGLMVGLNKNAIGCFHLCILFYRVTNIIIHVIIEDDTSKYSNMLAKPSRHAVYIPVCYSYNIA